VKSCSRPVCVKLEDAPAKCTPNQAKVTPVKKEAVSREVASVKVPVVKSVGVVKFLEGAAHKIAGGSKEKLGVGNEINEHDRITTERKAKCKSFFIVGMF